MKNRSEALREAIEEMIAVGRFAPGQHLDETVLSKEFGVSRTPVREALIQLATVGIVLIRPRRGAIVAEIGAQQLVAMFEVMAELEALCGRLAARRMTVAEHASLLEAHRACEGASADPDSYYYKNEAFHDQIYRGSHNDYLADQARSLHRRLRPYRRLQLRVRDRVTTSYAEHDEVVKAIVAGDGDRAAELLRNHVMIQGERFADLMASLSMRQKAAA